MNGPTIIGVAAERDERPRSKRETGIRRTERGWLAIVDGRLKAEFYGLGSKRYAIAAAGTNREIR